MIRMILSTVPPSLIWLVWSLHLSLTISAAMYDRPDLFHIAWHFPKAAGDSHLYVSLFFSAMAASVMVTKFNRWHAHLWCGGTQDRCLVPGCLMCLGSQLWALQKSLDLILTLLSHSGFAHQTHWLLLWSLSHCLLWFLPLFPLFYTDNECHQEPLPEHQRCETLCKWGGSTLQSFFICPMSCGPYVTCWCPVQKSVVVAT